MNFWVKTVTDEKIKKDKVVRNDLHMTEKNTLKMLQDICGELDIPTPLLTKSHYGNLVNFNFMKFRPSDFVESVDFDYLMVEYFVE